MRSKKGLEMATGTVVAIILGLFLLGILVFFVQQQIKTTGTQYEKIGKEAELGANKCQSLIKGTFCGPSGCSSTDPKVQYRSVAPPPGGWEDCAKISGKPDCCEKV